MLIYSVLFTIRGRQSHATTIEQYKIIATGFSTTVPSFCANNPVINGANAPPLLPIAEIRLKLDTCKSRGSNLLNTVAAQGYTGPSSRPTIEIATAFPMMLGTDQNITWSTKEHATSSTTDVFSPSRAA